MTYLFRFGYICVFSLPTKISDCASAPLWAPPSKLVLMVLILISEPYGPQSACVSIWISVWMQMSIMEMGGSENDRDRDLIEMDHHTFLIWLLLH